MVKNLDYITVRDYSLFERTKNHKYLCRFNVPFKLIEKQLAKLLNEITEKLSTIDEVVTIQKETHRISSLYRIQKLTLLYESLQNLMVNRLVINEWRKQLKLKLKDISEIKKYSDIAEQTTGRRIEKLEDLKWLKDKIEFWISKYKEHFDVKQDTEKVTFMQIVMGVFSAMNMDIQYDMCLNDFFLLKEEAEKLSRKMEEKWQTK